MASWKACATAMMERRERSLPGQQKLAVYMYSSLLLIVGIGCNLAGMAGPGTTVFVCLNTAHLIMTVLLLAGYLLRRLSLTVALVLLATVTQLEISAEMIHSE